VSNFSILAKKNWAKLGENCFKDKLSILGGEEVRNEKVASLLGGLQEN
jgi:hypothetical protein